MEISMIQLIYLPRSKKFPLHSFTSPYILLECYLDLEVRHIVTF